MTKDGMKQKAAREAAKYEAAMKIREILDALTASLGDEVEEEVLEIVTGDDD